MITNKKIVLLDDTSREITNKILTSNKLICFKLKVCGNSMYPTLADGDTVMILTVRPENIKPGDIIVYKHFETHLTIHRVMDIIILNSEQYLFVTKGDYSSYNDNYNVNPKQVIGKVIYIFNKNERKNTN